MGGTPVAYTVLALNIGIYALFAAQGNGLMAADSQALIRWGSNFGPLTTDGQWWRLLSAAFLHGGAVHLLVNMFTLFDVGRLCERIFGSARFLALYLLSGLLGSAASVWWNPSVNSVGASGALFGVLGATFVFMLDRRNGVPVVVMKTHAASLAVFIVYGIANGLTSSNIDNAAHLGGLVAGVVAGLMFTRGRSGLAAGAAACVAAILALAFLTPNTRAAFEQEKRFLTDLGWLTAEEKVLVASGRDLIARARAPGANPAELKPKASALVAQWQGVHDRFAAYQLEPGSKLAPTHQDIVAYADARRRALASLSRVFDPGVDPTPHVQEFNRLTKEGDAIVARMNARDKKPAR